MKIYRFSILTSTVIEFYCILCFASLLDSVTAWKNRELTTEELIEIITKMILTIRANGCYFLVMYSSELLRGNKDKDNLMSVNLNKYYNVMFPFCVCVCVCVGLHPCRVSCPKGSWCDVYQPLRPPWPGRVPAAGQLPAGEMERKVRFLNLF